MGGWQLCVHGKDHEVKVWFVLFYQEVSNVDCLKLFTASTKKKY